MASCFRVFYLLFPFVVTFIALILGAISFAGSTTTKSSVIESTYLIKIDLTHVNTQEFFNSDDQTLEQLGLSEIYTFGLWGYCKGNRNNNADSDLIDDNDITAEDIKNWFESETYNVTYCSKPKPMFAFDLIDTLTNDISSASEDLNISLPTDVKNYANTAKLVSKLVFVILLIGIITLALSLIFILFSFCSKFFSFSAAISEIIAFVALIIGSGAAIAVFNTIKKGFNNSATTYGILVSLGDKKFYILIWVSVALTFIAFVFNIVAGCIGNAGRRSGPQKGSRALRTNVGEDPFMGYEEKHIL
ncbi:hypothetical protein WICMUC_002808 [Wickerhamomyces mucosus]|uniref:Uncharacterized protein n=1 Tax=Wickerhamomyces mucosus TaxID=1378264 RepID=A0A9P8PN46_9ASCO|nr:hypothetical protein WICMUC_002808 [Wickerhamomyces mucosus]